MYFSLSSLLITVLFASVLILIFQIILNHVKAYRAFRIDFLWAFFVLVAVRLLLPFEFINTQTLTSQKILPGIYRSLRTPIAATMSVDLTWQHLFAIIWIVGAVCAFFIFIRQQIQLSRFEKCISKQQNQKLSRRTSAYLSREVPVYQTVMITSPFVIGVQHPKIILPQALQSSPYLDLILCHECQHIRNHDLLLKYLVKDLTCIYWWLAPIYLFQKQVSLVLEMHVDQQVQGQLTADAAKLTYAQSLVAVARTSQQTVMTKRTQTAHLLANFTILERHTLQHRIAFLLEDHHYRHTHLLTLVMIPLLALLVTSIVVEPDHANPSQIKNTFELPNQPNPSRDYILKKAGQYYLIIDEQNKGQIKNPNNINFKKFKIQKETE